MKIYYSAATNGFYPSNLKSTYESAGTWPADAVELSETEQSSYWRQQPPVGKNLGADANGRPVFVDLPPPSLNELSKTKSAEIDSKAQAFIDAEIEPYPNFEKLTFDRQELEARAILADNTVSTPTLSAIAESRGLTVKEVAKRVIAKTDAFAALAASIAGQRQAYHDQLAAAQDLAAVEAIIVNYELPA